MAYTCVRVTFEIGHEASKRAKKTSDGFTHDWEIFVRGADNTEIHYFVEKVIFHLHDTFQNPKRVVKEPPYVVRETGYAGFTLPVDIYLKNKQEPCKIRFKYQLTLQESGPPFSNVIREKYVFKNPSEDFRRKLIRGGGVGVGAESASGSLTSHMAALNADHSTDDHKNFVNNRNKSSPQDGNVAKKSKKENTPKNDEQLSANDPFSIFGQPIKTSKIPFVSKSTKPISESKALPQPEKQAHSSKSSKHSSSSHKDKEKEKERSAEKDKDKAKEKDKDRDKNAIKKPKEEVVKKEKIKEDKVKILKSSKEDSKKNTAYHEDAQKSKEKPVEKPVERAEKEIKVEKKDKEKKHKDEKKSKTKEKHKNSEKKENIEVKESGYDRLEQTFKDDFREEKKSSYKISAAVAEEKDDKPDRMAKEKQSEPKNLFSSASVNSLDSSVVNNGDSIRREEKHKHHKHKKDKSKKDSKRDKEERKEKKEAKENKEKRSPVPVEAPRSTPKSDSPKRLKKPYNRLFNEVSDKSDSELSSLNDEPPHERLVMKEPESPEISVKEEPVALIKQEEQTKEEKEAGKKKKKSNSNNSNNEEREIKKRKRKSKDKEDNATVKITKYDNAVSENALKQPMEMEHAEQRPVSMSPASETKFTDEYITKLKELQRKIMALEDNSGLQRIVQVVAETGQYEITTKTFDFDLCTLDESIVQRLLDFFVP